jgi:hypothetical protein
MTTKVESNKVATKATKATKSVELSEHGVKALATFNKAKDAEAKAKALKAEAELILQAELGKSLEATYQGVVVVKVIASKNSHFDRKVLLESYPEAYQATYKETPYTYIKTL